MTRSIFDKLLRSPLSMDNIELLFATFKRLALNAQHTKGIKWISNENPTFCFAYTYELCAKRELKHWTRSCDWFNLNAKIQWIDKL